LKNGVSCSQKIKADGSLIQISNDCTVSSISDEKGNVRRFSYERGRLTRVDYDDASGDQTTSLRMSWICQNGQWATQDGRLSAEDISVDPTTDKFIVTDVDFSVIYCPRTLPEDMTVNQHIA